MQLRFMDVNLARRIFIILIAVAARLVWRRAYLY